jgi:hypothetical protein
MLKKLYVASEDAVCRGGVKQLLQAWIDSRPAATDARTVLQLTQSFLSEGEQASLWKRENMRAMPVSARRMSGGGGEQQQQLQGPLEMEDVEALPPKSVAAALTLLRAAQFSALPSSDIVKFCTLTPDPLAFETYPRVAEFVDFGNTLGRWTKFFILKGGSKQGRGERIRWMFSLVQELEALRNFDLCFHLSTFATWELMPDIAQQAKVDLSAILEVVKRYGDRKFWNGQYHEALQEATQIRQLNAGDAPRPCIPLLVYHSNIISGGYGGSESLVEKMWNGAKVSYINVSKYRSIGEQQQLLSLCSGAEQAFGQLLKGLASRESDIYTYFLHASAPSDAGVCCVLCVLCVVLCLCVCVFCVFVVCCVCVLCVCCCDFFFFLQP